MVRATLVQANIRDVAVATDDDAIVLSGTVDTLADRTRAVELAAAISGPKRVENQIEVTGLGPLGEGDEGAREGRP